MKITIFTGACLNHFLNSKVASIKLIGQNFQLGKKSFDERSSLYLMKNVSEKQKIRCNLSIDLYIQYSLNLLNQFITSPLVPQRI
ncbi:hypothetical protein BpHYR1_004728 [Brachionus plicatilis]|uniref:Uncharacterized protein n=1 Tax=Brachionus plicatilis TaxID=10195 RepID=A0A3M7R3E6_BRAPC|nr:hypothetical protein BpHYR1_004728 [Brachionus plicatilis]